MASLFKRGNKWHARIKTDAGWVSRSLGTDSRKVARIKLEEAELREVDSVYRAANETTLHDAADDFEASRRVKGRAEGTFHMYGVKLGHLERIFGADMPLKYLQPPHGSSRVDKYVTKRLAEGASRSTIGKELSTLRGLLKVAKRAGKYAGDLAAVLPEAWSNDYEPRRTALSPAQVDALVKHLAAPAAWVDKLGREYEREDGAAERMNKAALAGFLVATGARWSEALGTERSAVDMKRGLVHFKITKTKRSGRGEKWVPITPLTRPLLEQVMAATAGRRVMFEPWRNVRRDLANACEALEIPKVTPNDLRRTHANWLRAAGVDLGSIADVLGHVDSRMVEKVYGKLKPEQLRDRVVAVVGGVH